MFELLASTQRRALSLMSFLSKSERNILCKCCAPDLKDYRAGVMDVEDNDENPIEPTVYCFYFNLE